MTWRSRWGSAAREPLLHFLLLGAAIYMLYGLAGPTVEPDEGDRITVSVGEINWLASSWEKRWNRPPTSAELAGLVDQYVRETVFYREALAMGLDRDDTIVRRRLAQKLEFLSQDLIATVPPTEEELRGYFNEHMERYQLPALTTLTHVFVERADGSGALCVEEELVRDGLAQATFIGDNGDSYRRLKAVEAEARIAKRGKWSVTGAKKSTPPVAASTPEPAQKPARNPTRNPAQNPAQALLVARTGGGVIHLRDCLHAARVKPNHLGGYRDLRDARASGRAFCKVCKPEEKLE